MKRPRRTWDKFTVKMPNSDRNCEIRNEKWKMRNEKWEMRNEKKYQHEAAIRAKLHADLLAFLHHHHWNNKSKKKLNMLQQLNLFALKPVAEAARPSIQPCGKTVFIRNIYIKNINKHKHTLSIGWISIIQLLSLHEGVTALFSSVCGSHNLTTMEIWKAK